LPSEAGPLPTDCGLQEIGALYARWIDWVFPIGEVSDEGTVDRKNVIRN
jgi:hypothetical protein